MSLRWRLSWLLALTAVLTVAAFGLLAYLVARDSAIDAAHARLRSAIVQINAITELGGVNQLEALRTAVNHPAVAEILRGTNGGPNGGMAPAVEDALRPLLGATPAAQAAAVVEMLGEDGHPRYVLPAGAPAPGPQSPLVMTPGGVVGPLYVRDGAMYFQSAVSLGHGREGLRVTRRVGVSSANRRIATNLLGPDAALLIGNHDGVLWSGTEQVHYPGSPDTPTRYSRNGTRWLSAAAAVKQTPWLYAVELPESAALAPARALIMPLVGTGLAIAVVGIVVGVHIDRRFAELGRQSSSVGHELRNPLGVMMTVVAMIDAMPEASPRLKEYAGLLREQLRLSERIITDVLDRARARAPVHSEVDVTELLDDVVIRAAVPPHIRVERQDSLPLPPVALDRDHVGQIVWNLITNAAQAIQGHLQRPGTITVSAGVYDERLRIKVCDTGPGLSASDAERIFEPMYTTKVNGVGLGLSISRAFARASGGDLFVAPSTGAGACFVLDLPATSRPIPS